MPTIHMTDVSVKALKSSEKYVTYFSDITPGFGIRVGKRSRTWIVMRGRSRERVSLGSYPQVSLADARKKAMQIIGADKAPPKPKPKTFKETRHEFLEEYFRDKSPAWKSNMTNYLMIGFKKLEHLKLDEIDDHHIKACLDALHETPSQQLHTFRGLRCFMRWCVRPPQRYIKHSPMEGYPPPSKDRKGTRFLTDHELKAVWQAADTYPNNVLRLIILWGTRRGGNMRNRTLVGHRRRVDDTRVGHEKRARSRNPFAPYRQGPSRRHAGAGALLPKVAMGRHSLVC